jgi:hypothetical protein
MLTVDPAKILTTLVKRGGLLIPKSIEKDIDALKKVMHVEQAELNIVEKKLILYNFTITVKGRKNAIRVGRVFVHWDSYTKPCIDIEVDDVEVLVEFTNLMLTQNNWNELQKQGFPPEMAATTTEPAAPASKSKPEPATSSFVRFSSIDLSGKAVIQVASRPLKKDIRVVTLDMDIADSINAKIRELSKSNKASTGRPGCTTTELSTLLQSYFTELIRGVLASTLKDVASDPSSFSRAINQVRTTTSDSVLSYASDAGRKTGEDIQDALVSKLSRFGLNADQFNALKERSMEELRKRSKENEGAWNEDTAKQGDEAIVQEETPDL